MRETTRLIVRADMDRMARLPDGTEIPIKVELWIDKGDYVLLDPTNYFTPEEGKLGSPGCAAEVRGAIPYCWAKVTSFSIGTAATYPIKVEFEKQDTDGFVPVGQYKLSEVFAVKHSADLGQYAQAEYWGDKGTGFRHRDAA